MEQEIEETEDVSGGGGWDEQGVHVDEEVDVEREVEKPVETTERFITPLK